MTQQVRRSYRRHRKTGWGVVLLAVSAVALFAIPFAHGTSPNRTLVFLTQPPSPAWQKGTTTTPALKLAVLQGTRQVSVNGTPVLHVASGSAGTDADFSFGSAVTGSTFWTFPDAKPLLSAPDGTYTLTATLGDLTATSNSFQVATEVCAGKSNCGPVSSNPAHPNNEGTGQVGVNNTLNNPVVVQFAPVGGATPKCANWNEATYTDASNQQVVFPPVTFGYTIQTNKMLQVTYLIRNAEWVLTQATRGNQDAQFCVGARHQAFLDENGDGAHPTPFTTADGSPAVWNSTDQLFWGVAGIVSNASKVTTDPVICGRGNTDLPTGPGGTSETWRTWTMCIPYDWDFTAKP